MKPTVAAALGVRLISVVVMLMGFVFILVPFLTTSRWVLAPTPSSPEYFMHDTYYVIYKPHFVMGGTSIVSGLILFVLSRPLGRLLAKGLADPEG